LLSHDDVDLLPAHELDHRSPLVDPFAGIVSHHRTPVAGLILCMPNHLAGIMSLGEVVQAAGAFVIVQGAFNWITDSYARIPEWISSAKVAREHDCSVTVEPATRHLALLRLIKAEGTTRLTLSFKWCGRSQ
jgi:hypothetical protein